jgi:hypothetical protein
MRPICANVEFFNASTICACILQIVPTPYMLISDVIKRNEIDFCRQYFSKEKITERTNAGEKWDSEQFVSLRGIYYRYWKKAIKYGRIEILKFFYTMYTTATDPQINPTNYISYSINLLTSARNTETRIWLLETFHGYILSTGWIDEITRGALEQEDIETLTWLQSHIPRASLLQPAKYGSKHTYLEYTMIYQNHYCDINFVIRGIVTELPKVYAWCQKQQWNIRIDWDKYKVL